MFARLCRWLTILLLGFRRHDWEKESVMLTFFRATQLASKRQHERQLRLYHCDGSRRRRYRCRYSGLCLALKSGGLKAQARDVKVIVFPRHDDWYVSIKDL
jgi:hypothetical protein